MENLNGMENCRNCVSRDFVTNRGLVCKRTGSNPNFEGQCADFVYDQEIDKLAPPPVEEQDPSLLLDEAQLLREENLGLAIVYGFIAAVIGAALWAAVSVATGWQIGYMAIAMGFIVGFAVQKGGKGIRPIFGVVGALFALFGCILGDYLSIIGFWAAEEQVPYMEMLSGIPVSEMLSVLIENLISVTILFYGFAIFQGYKRSFRFQMKEGGKI